MRQCCCCGGAYLFQVEGRWGVGCKIAEIEAARHSENRCSASRARVLVGTRRKIDVKVVYE